MYCGIQSAELGEKFEVLQKQDWKLHVVCKPRLYSPATICNFEN